MKYNKPPQLYALLGLGFMEMIPLATVRLPQRGLSKPGLVVTSSQETERVYSYNPGAPHVAEVQRSLPDTS